MLHCSLADVKQSSIHRFSPLDAKFESDIFSDTIKQSSSSRSQTYSTDCRSNSTDCSDSSYDFITKVILLGDQGVGKTSFLKALKVHPDVRKVKCQCRLSSDHVELEMTTHQGKLALVRLCDTGGQERYRSLTSSYYRGAHGALLMFDLNSQRSLDNLDLWIDDLDSFMMTLSPLCRVLVGNNSCSTSRAITPSDGRKFAESRGLPYLECDCQEYYNVIEGIQMVVEQVSKEICHLGPSVSTPTIRPSLYSHSEGRRGQKPFQCMC